MRKLTNWWNSLCENAGVYFGKLELDHTECEPKLDENNTLPLVKR